MRFMDALKWLSRYLKGHWGKIIFSALLTVLHVLVIFITPYVTGYIVDNVIIGGNTGALKICIILLISGSLIRQVTWYVRQLLMEWVSQTVIMNIRGTLFDKLQKLDLTFFKTNRTGDLMARMSGDMEAIRVVLQNTFPYLMQQLLVFTVGIITMYQVSPILGASLTVLIPVIAIFVFKMSKVNKPIFIGMREALSRLNSAVQENISGNRVVKAFAKEEYEKEKFEKENDKYRDAELGAASIWCRFVPIFELLSNLLMVVLILYGGYQVICGEMTLGNLVTVNEYLWMLSVPLRFAGWWVNDVQRFVTSVEKIYDTYSKEPDVKKPKKGIKRKEMQGNIEFRNVSYEVEGEDIIHNISFSVEKGQTVGILGSTGAGKSTIMNLLCRFYDVTEGEVLVDGINVKNWDLHDLRDNIGMAMQDVFLFSDTIEGNIAYGKPDCTFEEVKEAAVMSDANLFIKAMPDGYQTIVGERGVGLSGGQKQRISLARALLKKPSILILDDTTSAVDMETESYIQEQLKKLGRKHTVFVIAYRISSIKDADVIFVMDEGRIVECGNHESLLKQNGYYATVYKHQNGMEG